MASNDTLVSFLMRSGNWRPYISLDIDCWICIIRVLCVYVYRVCCVPAAYGWLWESTERYQEFNLINLLKRCRHFNSNLVRCWVALDLQWDKENFSHCRMQILESVSPKIATSEWKKARTLIQFTQNRIQNCQRRYFPLCTNVRGVCIKNRSTILQFTFECVTDWAGKRFSI